MTERVNVLENDLEEPKADTCSNDKITTNKFTQPEKSITDVKKREIKSKLRELEDRSSRNNLRIDGIKENYTETRTDTEEKVKNIFEYNLEVKGVQTERAHRTGSNDTKDRTIALKLLNYTNKESILKKKNKLKRTNIFINEDLCKEAMQIRKGLTERVKEERGKGKYAVT